MFLRDRERYSHRDRGEEREWENRKDIPGDPVVETSPSIAGSVGSTPGQGTKIPRALWPENQSIEQKQYCKQFNKDLKNGPHQKKKKKNLKKKKEEKL